MWSWLVSCSPAPTGAPSWDTTSLLLLLPPPPPPKSFLYSFVTSFTSALDEVESVPPPSSSGSLGGILPNELGGGRGDTLLPYEYAASYSYILRHFIMSVIACRARQELGGRGRGVGRGGDDVDTMEQTLCEVLVHCLPSVGGEGGGGGDKDYTDVVEYYKRLENAHISLILNHIGISSPPSSPSNPTIPSLLSPILHHFSPLTYPPPGTITSLSELNEFLEGRVGDLMGDLGRMTVVGVLAGSSRLGDASSGGNGVNSVGLIDIDSTTPDSDEHDDEDELDPSPDTDLIVRNKLLRMIIDAVSRTVLDTVLGISPSSSSSSSEDGKKDPTHIVLDAWGAIAFCKTVNLIPHALVGDYPPASAKSAGDSDLTRGGSKGNNDADDGNIQHELVQRDIRTMTSHNSFQALVSMADIAQMETFKDFTYLYGGMEKGWEKTGGKEWAERFMKCRKDCIGGEGEGWVKSWGG